MCPVMQPMTFDELTQIHREELKGKSLTPCRQDLYKAMADLLIWLRKEYDREIAKDPDSVMCEGANLRRKNAETLVKVISTVRAKKICSRAVNSADGGNEELSAFTPEEREYYAQVVKLSEVQLDLVNQYRGKKTVNTLIDEPVRTPAPEVPIREPEPMPDPSESMATGVENEFPAVDETFDDPMEEQFDEPVVEESFDDVPEPDPISPQTTESDPEPETVIPKGETILLRVLEDLPPFAGIDRDYELHKEDVVTLPATMAEILIKSNKAVAIAPEL